ncbi:MAG: prephenate dehydrogenase/arogenate dehydrogenase family protein [Acidobacteria bacterium]|nr:MAG: prephenate dehydrogenase/arogenate dehydrogenase family protein [Acidobacteriota bacterium]
MFRQITIIGVGLIGGSFALALKKHGYKGAIVGCDREPVLQTALAKGVVDRAVLSPEEAISGSDLVLLAAPVGAIVDLIERLGPLLPPDALLSDTGSTKAEIMSRARAVFGQQAGQRFLGGHPMAGKENSGVEFADPTLFVNAVWFLVSDQDQKQGQNKAQNEDGALTGKVHELCELITATLEEEFGDDPQLHGIGGRALREMTRISSSPYSMWRDIAHTNTENIEQALEQLEQRLAYIRENLRTPGLRDEFERANKFNSQQKKNGES